MGTLLVALPFVLVVGFVLVGALVVRARVRSGTAPRRRYWLFLAFWPYLAFFAVFSLVVAGQQFASGRVGGGFLALGLAAAAAVGAYALRSIGSAPR